MNRSITMAMDNTRSHWLAGAAATVATVLMVGSPLVLANLYAHDYANAGAKSQMEQRPLVHEVAKANARQC